MILIEWLTKPYYLFTPLDSFIMTVEVAAVIFGCAFIYALVSQK